MGKPLNLRFKERPMKRYMAVCPYMSSKTKLYLLECGDDELEVRRAAYGIKGASVVDRYNAKTIWRSRAE